jgi:hypothetical protein
MIVSHSLLKFQAGADLSNSIIPKDNTKSIYLKNWDCFGEKKALQIQTV